MPARLGWRAALMAALPLLALLHGWRFRHHLTDDAFIPLRYLSNLLAGHGLVYNVGEPVWGYTDFLWIVLLAPFVAAGVDPLGAARGLGVLSNGILFVWVLVRSPAGDGAPRRWNPAGAALLATSAPFLLQGLSGLETASYSLLVLATLALHASARRGPGWRAVAAGLMAAFATLMRPEAVLVFALLVADAILERRRSLAPLRGRLTGLALGFVPLVLVYEAGMWSEYAALWPNSIDAKVGLSLEQLRRGLHYAAIFAFHYPVHLLVPLAAAWRWKVACSEERLLLRAGAILSLLAIVAGGDWMLGYRLFHTSIVIGAVLAPFALAGIRREIPGTAAAAGLVAVLAGANLVSTFRDPHVAVASERSLVYAGIRIGEWMRANLPEGTLLATNTAGSIPYYSRLPIVDMMGLNDRVIARRRDLPELWRGSAVPLFLSDIELFTMEDFHRRYELLEIEIDAETPLRVWRRRERERGPLDAEELARVRRIAERQLELSAFRY
jgi:hypothetical protein